MRATQNVSIRFPTDLLERVDQAATREGMSRSEYVFSWLPETYDSNAEQQAGSTEKDKR